MIEPQFENAYTFEDDGHAVVVLDDKYGYINETGKFVIEPTFSFVNSFDENGLAFVFLNNEDSGYIDRDGNFMPVKVNN